MPGVLGEHLRRLVQRSRSALPEPPADDVLEPDERAAADEEDVRRVDLDVLLLGVLAAALRRHVGDGALEHLEQGLLHALAGHVAGDRDVVRGLADLVDLVDVDDAALGRSTSKSAACSSFSSRFSTSSPT
jgi:hypothetical protein